MRVLLIYPEFPDTFWSFKHALPFISKRASFPPLGLLTIASMLPQAWEKRLVDMNIESLAQKDIEWAEIVFVSAMVAQRQSTHEVVARCKEMGLPIVAGGPLFLGEHEQFPTVDHFVLGEGELSLPPFLADLERGQARRIYEAEGFAHMESSPMPLWELVKFRHYSSLCVQYSRGCPFDCDFCNITAMLGRKMRVKATEQIVAELDSLYRLGWRHGVFFVDDNFIGNKACLKRDLLPALIAWRQGKRGMGFQTEVSVNLADDPELLQLMAQAGFDTVFVGIETPDEQGLAECNKVQNQGRDLVSAVKTMQHAGLQVQGGFIVGFDSDTPSIFQRQIDFIQRSGIVTAMVGLLQAPYGTRLYERLRKENRLVSGFSGNNTDDTMNFDPKMDPEVLHEGYRRILTTIYSPRYYYQRVRSFLSEYEKSAVVRSPLGWNYIAAFFRSIVRLGVRGKERLEYWKLVVWTLLRRPRLFPEAITLAIYGFHFRRVCELYVSPPAE
jgi:radical SAM superfamily enzyme YgiQ (UPF0313 family)